MTDTEAGPGMALRTARKAMNVEPREVADALNLPLSVVLAIEQNDFAELPSAVFARGYVRSYAKLLELDPDPLVKLFPVPQAGSLTSEQAQGDRPNLRSQVDQFVRENQRGILIGAGVVGLALLVWALTWLLGDSEPTAAETAAAAQTAAANPQGTAAEPGSALDGDGAATASGGFVADATTAAGAAAMQLSEGQDELVFEFTEECWVEIRSNDGVTLYSELGRPNAKLNFVGGGPFSILLGYAPGASMSYNGEPVALEPHTRNNVATLVLGQ